QERERFFALSLDLLAIVGLDGSLKQVNPAWERVLGWSREEILALPLAERVHPEDVAGSFAAIDGIAAGETLGAFENRCRCKDGSSRWIRGNATLIEGEQLYYPVGRDITERKQREEELQRSKGRFELAVVGSQDGLWDWDVATNRLYLSPRYKSLLGFADHE